MARGLAALRHLPAGADDAVLKPSRAVGELAEVGRWLNAGDSVVALGAYRGTCRKTGKSMQAAFAHVYWLEKGRIVRFEQYADTAKIAEACADD